MRLGKKELSYEIYIIEGTFHHRIDETLQEWPENDYRLFVGDLGKETTDAMLIKEFSCYKSFAKVFVIYYKMFIIFVNYLFIRGKLFAMQLVKQRATGSLALLIHSSVPRFEWLRNI